MVNVKFKLVFYLKSISPMDSRDMKEKGKFVKRQIEKKLGVRRHTVTTVNMYQASLCRWFWL